jgi:hypothetical protein
MRYKVYTVDGDVFYTGAPPTYERDGGDDGPLMCVFVPKNGRDIGKVSRIPMARVTNVVEDEKGAHDG